MRTKLTCIIHLKGFSSWGQMNKGDFDQNGQKQDDTVGKSTSWTQNNRGRETGRGYTQGWSNNSIFQVLWGPPVLLQRNPVHIYKFFIHLMINLCRGCQYWLERNFMVITYISNTFNIYIYNVYVYIYIYMYINYIYNI